MEPETSKLKQLIMRHRLPFAVTGFIGVALILTAISMSLYITSGASTLDLSRPGYSQVREQLVTQPSESFSESGPMDAETAEQFKKLFDSQRSALRSLGDYSDTSLDDTSLQLNAR